MIVMMFTIELSYRLQLGGPSDRTASAGAAPRSRKRNLGFSR